MSGERWPGVISIEAGGDVGLPVWLRGTRQHTEASTLSLVSVS